MLRIRDLGSATRLERPLETIPILCAWCPTVIGHKKAEGMTRPTHGICPKCYQQQLEALEAIQARRKA